MVGEGEGDSQLWGEWTWCHCRVPLLCGMVGEEEGDSQLWGEWTWCHCRVPLLCGMVGEEEGDGQLWGSGRGAIAGCHCCVLWWGKGGDGQLWGSGHGAIGGCHCSVLWSSASVTTIEGVDVPLQGARGTLHSNGIQESIQKNCLELLAAVALFTTLIAQKLIFAIWGLCRYNDL